MEAQRFNLLIKNIKYNNNSMEIIFNFYYPRIVKRISFNYGLDLAEDVAQEFFYHLLDICDTLSFIRKPTSWVYTCVDNIAKRKIYYDSRFTSLEKELRTQDTIQEIENKIYLDELLNYLNEKERRIIELFYLEGYNNKEIAEIMQIKPMNVRQIHSRAIKKLRKFI